MSRDRIMTIAAFFFGLLGCFAVVSAKFTIGIALIAVGLCIFWVRGSGRFNERSPYEKIVKANGYTIMDIYEEIQDVDSPFGKPWIAGHVGYPGESIVFGPNVYKDMIVISYDEKRKEINLKHINKIGNINRTADEEWRFDNVINAADIEVTPANYSDYAASKLLCVVMLRHLTEIIENIVAGETGFAPESLDKYKLHYYNSKEGFFVDSEGSRYYTAEQEYEPFTAKLYNLEGEEVASIVPRAYDKKNRVADKAGYDMYMGGKQYADISRNVKLKHDTFVIDADGKEFIASNFAGVDRANIKYNYIITLEGRVVAVVGGNPKLVFDELGECEHDVIMSMDEKYQDVYDAFWIFVMTLNRVYKKKK